MVSTYRHTSPILVIVELTLNSRFELIIIKIKVFIVINSKGTAN